jgi:hypothetical protein
MAAADPDTNFIGIEVHRPGVGKLLHSMAELGVDNIRVYCHDAVEVLRDCIPAASLDKVQSLPGQSADLFPGPLAQETPPQAPPGATPFRRSPGYQAETGGRASPGNGLGKLRGADDGGAVSWRGLVEYLRTGLLRPTP